MRDSIKIPSEIKRCGKNMWKKMDRKENGVEGGKKLMKIRSNKPGLGDLKKEGAKKGSH